MARFDYNKEHFEQVKVCGFLCLFNDGRIDRSTVPKEKYLYEIGGDDDSGAEPARVKRVIWANFFGTLICDKRLPLGEDNVLWLQEGDFVWN